MRDVSTMRTEKKAKKKKLWLIPVVVVMLTVIVLCILVVKGVSSQKVNAGKDRSVQDAMEVSENDTLTWNEKKYQYNEHLSNFLFLGIDKREQAETETGMADAGQADVLFLMSWNRMTDEITVISIPRDTMTEIEIFGLDGTSVAKSKDHINLSYAYGDGRNKSCELTKAAVSNLLYGVPIQGYCSLNIDGLSILTRRVGSVTVTVPNDSLEEKYPEFAEGAQVVLDEENTETFVRYRDITKSQTALKRMERQYAFLDGYMAAAQQEFQEDPGFITQMYLDLEPYMVTNMGNDQFVKVMESAMKGNETVRWTIPGEGVEGAVFDEYHVDDEALYEQIIETFYIEEK